MQQTTLSDIEYSNRRRKTRREKFLNRMDAVIPWDYWVEQIRPYYPPGKRGRPPRDIEMMLRMFLMQAWFQLSAEGMEDVIYDSYAMRKFMHLDFMEEQVPSSSTLLKFRHLLDQYNIGERILSDARERLSESGFIMREGKIIDPRLISLPASLSEDLGKEEKRPDQKRVFQMTFDSISPKYDKDLAALIRELLEKHHLDIPGTAYYDESLDHLSLYYGAKPDERQYDVVLDEAGKLVGGIGLAEFPAIENCCELQKLYLADREQGSGFGYEMIRHIEEKARGLGYEKIYLETHTNLEAALHIYERSGFRAIQQPESVVHSTMNRFYIKDL